MNASAPARRQGAAGLIAGDGLAEVGDWDGALARYELAEATGAPRAAAHWRIGLVHHLRGDLDLALRAYAVTPEPGEPAADGALLLAWRASARWLRGDAGGCREDAESALTAAGAAGDARALAAAHTAMAMLAALEGDRHANARHYEHALAYAERAQDALQVVRIRANRGSRLNEEGSYRDAVVELDAALASTGPGVPPTLEGLALSNRAEALFRLGRLDEARADLDAARRLFAATGSRMVAYASHQLGDVLRERGGMALARLAYEEALHLGEASGDLQAIVPALVGLAHVLLHEDLDAAAAHSGRALAAEPGMAQVRVLLAAGAIASARGDTPEVLRLAETAARASRLRRDLPGLAEALALSASADHENAVDRLEQAIAIWQEVGDPLGEARAATALAVQVGGERGRSLAEEAEVQLRGMGASGHAASAADVARRLRRELAPPVAVETLGVFRVVRQSEPIPHTAWGSRKARDLLKLLVAQHGRPLPRDAIIEVLWPGASPTECRPRLSVALSTLRRVLDPGRRLDGERLIIATTETLRLDLESVDVDVERFLGRVAQARQLEAAGADASEPLMAAEALYRGDFLVEDRYEDWAAPLRDEAATAYAGLVRRLAAAAVARGDADAATRRFVRLLELDPYDEHAHLGLVRALLLARRHGEARRCFACYEERMEALGVAPSPFPGAD